MRVENDFVLAMTGYQPNLGFSYLLVTLIAHNNLLYKTRTSFSLFF